MTRIYERFHFLDVIVTFYRRNADLCASVGPLVLTTHYTVHTFSVITQ